MENFQHCRVGCLPFKYFGLLLGANPMNELTWELQIRFFFFRLGSCMNVLISLDGMVALLNAVLNVINIYLFSFIKMFVSVYRKIVCL